MKIGVWQIDENKPLKLNTTAINLEKELEGWIEADPALLKSGLVIVGRQLSVEAGFIDLLAIDSQGRWIVIEIKRGKIERQTIAQVIDYASCITTIPSEELITKANSYLQAQGRSIEALLKERSVEEVIEPDNRDIELMVVGVGKMTGLDRMIEFLAEKFQMPISVISFKAFQSNEDKMLLVRELSEPDFQPSIKRKSSNTVDQICDLADTSGVGGSFRDLLAASNDHGLYARPYKKSIMYTHPSQRNRMLFTVWAEKQNNGIRIYVGPTEFAEFYPVSEKEAASLLEMDNSGWRFMDEKQVKEFIARMKKLFEIINERADAE